MKRRIISIFMSVIVPINIIVPVYASAADVADNNSSVYIGNGYVVYYDIKSSWGNNQNIEIKIKNIGSETISNWALYNVPLVKTQMKKIIVTAKTLYSHPKNVSKIYAALHTDLAW